MLQLVRVTERAAEWDGTGDEGPLEAVSHHHQLLNGELDSLALGIPMEGGKERGGANLMLIYNCWNCCDRLNYIYIRNFVCLTSGKIESLSDRPPPTDACLSVLGIYVSTPRCLIAYLRYFENGE